MSWRLSRETIKEFVITALRYVADFNANDPNLESYTFQHFHGFHKVLFLNVLRKQFLDHRSTPPEGSNAAVLYYDVLLNEGLIDTWATLGDCISYLTDKQQSGPLPPKVPL
jgi:hypothetical protein